LETQENERAFVGQALTEKASDLFILPLRKLSGSLPALAPFWEVEILSS